MAGSSKSERKFPSWIKAYQTYMLDKVSPEIYCVWAAHHAIAAALQRKVWIPYRGRPVYPNLFALLVGPPRIGKSTAIICVREIMTKVETIYLAGNSMSKEKLYVNMEEAGHKLCSHDVPGEVNPYFHASYNITHTEFGVMLTREDRAFMSALTQLYDCEPVFIHDVKTAQSSQIDNVFLNMIGATTERDLRNILPEHAFDSGFAARINIVYADSKRPGIKGERPSVGSSRHEAGRTNAMIGALALDLNKISEIAGPFDVTQEVYDAFHLWWDEDENDGQPKVSSPYFVNYNLARDIHLLKLCMIHSAAKSNSRLIELEDFLSAKEVLEITEADMPRALTFVSGSDQQVVAERAYSYLLQEYAKTKQPVPEHVVRNILFREIPSQYIKYVLDQMVLMNWVEKVPSGGLHCFKPKVRKDKL